MTQQKIITIAQILKRPNSAFKEISENPGHYFVSSVAIFAISAGLSFYSSYTSHVAAMIEEVGYEWSAAIYAIESVQVVASALLVFAVIFYVGKRFGGTSDFKKIFSVLSHCLIPMIIGTAIVSLGTGIFYEFVFVDGHYYSGKHDDDDGLAPSYALDFALQQSMVFGLVALPFVAWSVILAVKAVKTANNFEAKRSFGIIILSGVAMYLFMILYNISFSIVFYLRLT